MDIAHVTRITSFLLKEQLLELLFCFFHLLASLLLFEVALVEFAAVLWGVGFRLG